MDESWIPYFHNALLMSHIGFGCIGLIIYWVILACAKGTRFHVRLGWIFAFCAYWVSLSGLVASIWARVDPIGFVESRVNQRSPEGVPNLDTLIRFFFSFLSVLSSATLVAVHFAIRAIRTRPRHEDLREPLLLGLEGLLAFNSLALIVFALWNLMLATQECHPFGDSAYGMYSLLVALGAFTLFGVVQDLRYIYRPRPSRMAWWYKHMEKVIGLGIGFHTAFLVFGASRFLSQYLHGPLQVIPWILPTAIGLPATTLWINVYRRKFGEL